jgi:hypothetical protein
MERKMEMALFIERTEADMKALGRITNQMA